MVTLREQINLDLQTFFNANEFGEEMLVDGVPCLGSWQEEKDEPVKQFFGSGMDNVPGIFAVDRVLFVIRKDGRAMVLPVPTQEMEIDSVIWTVRDAVSEGGVIKLVLFRTEA